MTQSIASRVVKAVNITIAVLLAAGAALVAWYVLRPLPQRSGTIDAPVAAGATVNFDTHGEPHIRAASVEDAFFVQGYVTAQDRLWQMDALRRFSGGSLAEILGPNLLESDRESRKLRMRRIAEDAYVTLPAADRAAFAAYTRGVNQFIATHRNNLPVEFTLLNYQPRPWSVVDCLLLCLHMYRNLTTTWKDEIVKNNMLAQGDRAKVEFLFPMHGIADASPGSNSWAMAGSRTASGKPLLSSDMHLEYSLPGIWYMTHLEAPGLNVAGVALPGAPGIMVGHNQRIAWGITNLHFDVQDLYIEKLDERTGRYLFRGQVEQARGEREDDPRQGRAQRGNDELGDAPRPDLPCRRQAAAGPALDRRGARHAAISFHRHRPRAELAGVHRRDRAAAGSGIELRVRRRGRQYRLPRRRRAAAPAQLSRRRSGGWRLGQLRVGRLYSVRRTAERVQSAERADRLGQPEYVSREFSLPAERELRAAVPRPADSRAALPPATDGARRTCWRCRRTFTPRSAISWRANWWAHTRSATRTIRIWMAR